MNNHHLQVKPVAVQILTKEKFLSADEPLDLECKSFGSRPGALITWWMGTREIRGQTKHAVDSGNHTVSVLTVVPTWEDDGKLITCRAENPFIPESAIEDKWRLLVHCE